jgi:hypothetical protein
MEQEDETLIIERNETIIIDTEHLTVKATNIVESVPPTPEENLLISQIGELAKKISCDSVHHLGSLNDYEKIIEFLKSKTDTTLPLSLNLSPLQNLADMANDLEKIISSIEIYFKKNCKITYLHELEKIYQYLSDIDKMLNKFEDLVVYIKANIIYAFPSSLVDINKLLDQLLCDLNHITQNKPCSCELYILNRSIKKEKHNVRKIKCKLNKLGRYQSKLDKLAYKLSSKDKYC